MILSWTPKAWDQYHYWYKNDLKTFERVNILLEQIKRQPFSGVGKPEPLKHQYKGFWSRRINSTDRLVYKVETDQIYIVQCRFHY